MSAINVHLTIGQIRIQSIILNDFEKEGKIIIVGGLNDIETGLVFFYDEK